MAAAAGSAPAPVGFKGRRASVTPRRSKMWSSATGSHRASPACHAGVFTGSLADESRRMDLHHRCPGAARLQRAALLLCHVSEMDLPRGRAPRCPRYQRGASLSTLWQNKGGRRCGGSARPRSGCRLIPSPFPPLRDGRENGGSCRSCTDLTRLMIPLPLLLGQGTGKCGPPRMCAGFSRLRVGCIVAYACGPKGAGGATCTRTPRWARSFEVSVSACFTTPAETGAEGETCTPKAHWLSTRSVC
jgi:hypothetical protein